VAPRISVSVVAGAFAGHSHIPAIERRLIMKRDTTIRRMPLLATAVAATLLFAAPAGAQPPGGVSQEEMQKMMQQRQAGYGGPGMGPGATMGGGGMGMMGGGMMDMMMGDGMGGMGMMGMGPGTMMGGGMMGGLGMLGMLDLTDEQRAKIRKIEDEQRKKNRELYGKIEDESVKLRDLYDADTPDARKIGAVYDKIFDLKREAIVAGIDAHNKARAVLTKEQQEQLKGLRRGKMPMGPRGGMMGPGMTGR
jgi:Spy/CpxP family protein refolding chaperone